MALNFTTTLTLPTGIEVANAYGRVSAADQLTGTQIDAMVDIYASEAAFNAGLEPLQVRFDRGVRVAYDRATDGNDILNIGHDALITMLAGLPSPIIATKDL